MTKIRSYSDTELLAVLSARNLKDGQVVFAGIGIPLLAACLAQRSHCPSLTILFEGGDTLYGRYWGAIGDFHSLHFECCYHQGIEFCIERGISRFEPGTQGEHKVSRGFAPHITWSAHHLVNPQLRAAVAEFLSREAEAVDNYAAEIELHTPFRRP